MFPKTGKFFPKKGRFFPEGSGGEISELRYAMAIAAALRQELGKTHRATKTIMKWTGASDRTVKNWLAGAYGPSGWHLIGLARHSDSVLWLFLRWTGRENLIGTTSLIEARENLKEILRELDSLIEANARRVN